MSELKPCPFCGGEVEIQKPYPLWDEHEGILYHTMIDHRCKHGDLTHSIYTQGKGYKTEGDAFNAIVDAWNHRADRWIPVSERLPDELEAVIVYGNNRNELTKGCEVCWLYQGEWTAWWTKDITHWMPIKPPEGVDQG